MLDRDTERRQASNLSVCVRAPLVYNTQTLFNNTSIQVCSGFYGPMQINLDLNKKDTIVRPEVLFLSKTRCNDRLYIYTTSQEFLNSSLRFRKFFKTMFTSTTLFGLHYIDEFR